MRLNPFKIILILFKNASVMAKFNNVWQTSLTCSGRQNTFHLSRNVALAVFVKARKLTNFASVYNFILRDNPLRKGLPTGGKTKRMKGVLSLSFVDQGSSYRPVDVHPKAPLWTRYLQLVYLYLTPTPNPDVVLRLRRSPEHIIFRISTAPLGLSEMS